MENPKSYLTSNINYDRLLLELTSAFSLGNYSPPDVSNLAALLVIPNYPQLQKFYIDMYFLL